MNTLQAAPRAELRPKTLPEIKADVDEARAMLADEDEVAARPERDPAAVERLILDNIGLARKVAGRFARSRSSWLDYEDLLQEGLIALRAAAIAHDPARGAFSTVATKAIVRRLSSCVHAARRSVRLVCDSDCRAAEDGSFISDIAGESPRDVDHEERVAERFAQLSALMETNLSGREILALELRFGIGGRPPMSHELIGRELGISGTVARLITQRGEDILRRCASGQPVRRRLDRLKSPPSPCPAAVLSSQRPGPSAGASSFPGGGPHEADRGHHG